LYISFGETKQLGRHSKIGKICPTTSTFFFFSELSGGGGEYELKKVDVLKKKNKDKCKLTKSPISPIFRKQTSNKLVVILKLFQIQGEHLDF
jgi:hypothetical protein